jgi:hypothetical protein
MERKAEFPNIALGPYIPLKKMERILFGDDNKVPVNRDKSVSSPMNNGKLAMFCSGLENDSATDSKYISS